MTYQIHFDNDTGLFSAYSRGQPLTHGEGKSLEAAIDNLETNLERLEHSDKVNIKIEFGEKEKSGIALTAKVSLVV